MEISKVLPNIQKPFSFVHNTLTNQGFIKTEKREETIYQAKFQDATTQQEYSLNVPMEQQDENGRVKLGQAYFGESHRIPSVVIEAATSKLVELSDYLMHGDHSRREKPISEVDNGYMTKDLDDMKKLGKEMEQMSTGQELRRKGQRPDPAQ